MSNRGVVALGTLLFAAGAVAGEIFVDAKNGQDGDGRGSEAAPYLTIQAAVDVAKAGDTITLFPGDYTNGVRETTGSKNRVIINKKLTIRSKEGRKSRDETRIVGAWDETEIASTPYGYGPNAIRCVWLESGSSGTVLEGITFYRGSVPYNSNNGTGTCGGGVHVSGSSIGVVVKDCAFIECQGTRGGGLYTDQQGQASSYGDHCVYAVRTLFKRCRCSKYGYAMRGGMAVCCVFDDNDRARDKSGNGVGEGSTCGAFSYGTSAVNCTFVNNFYYGMGGEGTFNDGAYNCIFLNNSAGAFGSTAVGSRYYSCVNDASKKENGSVNNAIYNSLEVCSPCDNDYRLTTRAKSLTTGNFEYLTKIPEAFRDKDYYGNPRTTDGVLYCGASQTVADSEYSGVAVKWTASGEWSIDGETPNVACRTWKGAPGYHNFLVKYTSASDAAALLYYTKGESAHMPCRDDAVPFVTSGGIAQTVNAVVTSTVYWTDPEYGDDDNDGSKDHPFKTLQKAVCNTTGAHVVYAKAGDYKDGGAEACGLMSRVTVPVTLAGPLRVVAVDGPATTYITGKAGTDDATTGYGSDAVRCVSVASTNAFYAIFQGFTLRGGRASSAGTDWQSYGGALANVDAKGNNLGTAYLLDCALSDCSAPRAACFGGTLMRCRMTRCCAGNSSNGNGILRNARVYSSLIADCPNSTSGSTFVLGPGARAYNCTIVNNVPGGITDNGSNKAYAYNTVFGKRNNQYAEINVSIAADQFLFNLYRTSTYDLTDSTSVMEDPVRFIDGDGGDYRLDPDSAGIALGAASYLSMPLDVDGKPFAVSDDGRLVAGCYSKIVPKEYFVDAEGGDDANDGLSEASAMKTLAAVVSRADFGDTITALPGTYSEGTMLPKKSETGGSAEPTLPARVVLHRNVTLQSRDGAEVTVIAGAEATGGGCGDDAVRCAFLARDAKLKGFTLSGGYTAAKAADESQTATVNNYGGGVACCAGSEATASEFSALVADCVITNCHALRGGGASYGIYWNCRFFDNTLCATKPGFAVRNAKLVGCYFAANGKSGDHSTVYDCDLVNCTLRGNQAQNNGVALNEGSYASARSMINTICDAAKIKVDAMTNCVMGASTAILSQNLAAKNLFIGDEKLNADGSIKRRSSAVDQADASLAPEWFLVGKDLAGKDRVMGEGLDIGAFEYDTSLPVPGCVLFFK